MKIIYISYIINSQQLILNHIKHLSNVRNLSVFHYKYFYLYSYVHIYTMIYFSSLQFSLLLDIHFLYIIDYYFYYYYYFLLYVFLLRSNIYLFHTFLVIVFYIFFILFYSIIYIKYKNISRCVVQVLWFQFKLHLKLLKNIFFQFFFLLFPFILNPLFRCCCFIGLFLYYM